MRIDPLVLIKGASELVTVIYGPAVTFAFPDPKLPESLEVGAAPETNLSNPWKPTQLMRAKRLARSNEWGPNVWRTR